MKGFSLVETLVVLAVLGVLLTLGLPFYGSLLEARRLEEARAELSGFLRHVGGRALLESQGYTVEFTPGSGTLRWRRADGREGSFTLPHGARVLSVSPSPQVGYTGRGFPLGQYRVEVGLGRRSRPVVLLPTGKVVAP